MTNEELAFLRDLRRVMRDHKVELRVADSPMGDEMAWFAGPEIQIYIDGFLPDELKDQGGTRDEV